MKNIFYSVFPVLLSITNTNSSLAQFSLTGQLIQRSEYLHGYGTLSDTSQEPAIFIGQRARIGTTYNSRNFKIYLSAQDIRTWGNTSQLKLTDGLLSIHEAWGEIFFAKKFSGKFGRQELDYDDARFLGNVDWTLQARAHDFALLKFSDSTLSIHAGGAFNQEKQNQLSGNYYSIAGQYKTAQFFWLNKQIQKFNISALFWNNGMQYLETGSDGGRKESIKYSQTFGLPKIEFKSGAYACNAFYYHQSGKDASDKTVNSFDAGTEISYSITLSDSLKNKLRIAAGAEYLSGTSQTDTANRQNNSFNPLYGTNHRHNGYMDYFFAGGRHINSVGLQDVYLKIKYDFNPEFFLSLNTHWFSAVADIRDKKITAEIKSMDKNLGYEADLTFGWIINEGVSLQGGYSVMFATNSMEMLRGGDANLINYWGYVMFLFRPEFKNRFTGLKV